MIHRFISFLFILVISASVQAATPEEVRRAVKAAGGVEPLLKKIAEKTASTLPMKLNQNVEVSMVISTGKNIRYQNRLLIVENRAAVYDMNALKSANINYAVCSSPETSVLIKEYGAQFTYVVLSRNSEYLFEYALNKETCKGR